MNLFRTFVLRKNRRSTLRDLHSFGLVNVFRRHSIFRLWEPLREHPITNHDFMG